MHAAFLVASHRRPAFMPHVLDSLLEQDVPPNWTFEVMVAGRPDDPSRVIVESQDRCRYFPVDSDGVTAKLNHLLGVMQCDLVLLADDDDLQPSHRLRLTTEAYQAGAEIIGGSSFWSFDPRVDRVTRWGGPGTRGLVGTSLAVSAPVLVGCGGWPDVPKGKDGHLMHRLRRAKYTDLTDKIMPVCIEHGENITDRKHLQRGEEKKYGCFHLTGFGPLAGVEGQLHHVDALQALLGQGPEPAPADLPSALLTCSQAGPGQSAFIDGLVSLGFVPVNYKQSKSALAQGQNVLFHGWWPGDWAALAQRYPKQFFALWHSGFTGSDLMGEHDTMAQAIEATQAGHGTLLWLESRDVIPPKAVRMVPVWDPARMRELAGRTLPKRKNSLLVAFHGKYPSLAKNVLASVVGAAATNAELHVGATAYAPPRDKLIPALLSDRQVFKHGTMPRKQAVALAASVTLMCHVSTSDTWPYMVMEAIYAGTPVLLSDVVAWTTRLPQWAQDLCIVRPATSSVAIRDQAQYLLDNGTDRARLLAAQEAVLDELAPRHLARAKKILNGLGFPAAEVAVSASAPTSASVFVNALEPTTTRTTSDRFDLRDKVTVFVISSGEPSLAGCHQHLDKQDCTFTREDIAGVSPMWRAFQEMLDRCETPYYIQVDADMLLERWAVRELYERIVALEKEPRKGKRLQFKDVALVGAWLWDDDVERPIQGVKVYRHDICKNYPFREGLSCEQTQNTALQNDGHEVFVMHLGDQVVKNGKWRKTRRTFGLHFASQTPEMAFTRWQRLAQKHRALPSVGWVGEYVQRLEARWLADSTNDIAKARYLGCIAGLSGPIPTGELDAGPNLDYRRIASYVGEYSKGPREISIYLTDKCNARCVWCQRQHGKMPTCGDMSPHMLLRVLKHYPSVKTCCLAGFGEPLLHPQLPELVRVLRQEGVACGLITNGILLAEKAELVRALDLAYLSVSINGHDGPSHRANTQTETWEQVLAGLRAMKGVPFRVGISHVTTTSNIETLPAVLALGKDLGVQFIHAHNLLPHGQPDYESQVLQFNDEKTGALLEEARQSPGAALVESWPQLVDLASPPPRRCMSPFLSVGFDALGRTTHCRRVDAPSGDADAIFKDWIRPARTNQIACVTGDRDCDACDACFAQWRA